MGTPYKDFREEMLKDPDVKREYDALEPEFATIQTMLDTRKSQGLIQKELALDEADRAASASDVRHTADEVFGRARKNIRTV